MLVYTLSNISFQGCIGAIDGVHATAVVPLEDQIPYIGRKGVPTQNIMAACNIVDAGYPQVKGYLKSYKGKRYHLSDFQLGSQPIHQRKVFDHAHSSLRIVIECIFRLWKQRWRILRDTPGYHFEKQVKMVIATLALHNYIRGSMLRTAIILKKLKMT